MRARAPCCRSAGAARGASSNRVTPRRALAVASALLVAVAIAGCASTYYDPLAPAGSSEMRVPAPRGQGLEQAYRLLYARLERCLGSAYHVQPRFERAAGRAWLMLVSGLGLNRLSLLGNRFVARIDLAESPDGIAVTVTRSDDAPRGLEVLTERWLAGSQTCHV